MAHQAQRDFFLKVRDKFPDKFQNCYVLDIGSLDINGNNKYLFSGDFLYTGVDVLLREDLSMEPLITTYVMHHF